MKRKTSNLPTRIYTYGCRLPTANGDLVEQQILLAHRYYNKLIEIERRRREKVRSIQREAAPGIVEHEQAAETLDEEIAQILAGIKARKAEGRTAKVEVSADRVRLSELRVQRKEHYAQAKAARSAAKTPEVLERMRAAGAVAAADVREARANCGVYWGTYLTVEAAVEAAKKSPTDPEFRRWRDGAGRVAVQIQNGIPVAEAFGGDTRIQLDPPAPNRMSKVRLRIGTNPDRSPIFAECPFRYHRPMPADARIKWAWISKSLKGRWVNWDLQIVLEAGSFTGAPRQPSDGGVVAIDIGWRLRPGCDLRVGYWLDDQGKSGELLMPADLKQRLEHADSLRGIQDRAFDAIKARLLAWREGRELAAELAAALEFLPQWKSAKQLGAVVDEWRAKQWPDQDIIPELAAWWKQHRHLYDWEQCERDRALAARKNLYREWAAKFTRQYAVVVLEDFDLRQVAEKPAADAAKPALPKPARHQRQETAPSEFVGALKSAAPGNRCAIAEVECAYTTQRCSRCGHVKPFDAAALIKPACERCGDARSQPIDQDREAAANLLAAWVGKSSRSQTAPEEPKIVGPHSGAVEMPAQEAVS